jgi:hypothetical protein
MAVVAAGQRLLATTTCGCWSRSPTLTLLHGDDGRLTGHIGTGTSGARTVDLGPLCDRVRRLDGLDQRRAEIERSLIALPLHPWAKSRNT